jgi:hypothetical protein
MFISPSLLERVYVKGSLKNVEGGFEFKLKNNVDSGTLGGIRSLIVDDVETPLASITIGAKTMTRSAQEITTRAPFSLMYGTEATISVSGEPLAAGAHSLALTLMVLEIGKLERKFSDEVQE